jgi:hypothetical protein
MGHSSQSWVEHTDMTNCISFAESLKIKVKKRETTFKKIKSGCQKTQYFTRKFTYKLLSTKW